MPARTGVLSRGNPILYFRYNYRPRVNSFLKDYSSHEAQSQFQSKSQHPYAQGGGERELL
jgi:hypothetical protein